MFQFPLVKTDTYPSGQEIRCVRLQHNSAERNLADCTAGLRGFGVGYQRCEAHIQVWELCQEGFDD